MIVAKDATRVSENVDVCFIRNKVPLDPHIIDSTANRSTISYRDMSGNDLFPAPPGGSESQHTPK